MCNIVTTRNTRNPNPKSSDLNAAALFYSAVVRLNPGQGIIPMVGADCDDAEGKSYVNLHHLREPAPLKRSSPALSLILRPSIKGNPLKCIMIRYHFNIHRDGREDYRVSNGRGKTVR